jgi:uncharacterized membrane protein YhaH (DUF805 family)
MSRGTEAGTTASATRASWFEVDRLPLPGATPMQAVRRFVGNAYVVHARAGRAEFWWIWLVQTVLGLVVNLGIGSLVRGASVVSWSVGAYGSSLFAPWPVVVLGRPAGAGPAANLAQGASLEVGQFSIGPFGPAGPAWGGMTWVALVWGLWCLMTFVPMATLTIRRLHGVRAWGWGWFWLGALIPFLQIVVVFLLARETQPPSARFLERERDLHGVVDRAPDAVDEAGTEPPRPDPPRAS